MDQDNGYFRSFATEIRHGFSVEDITACGCVDISVRLVDSV